MQKFRLGFWPSRATNTRGQYPASPLMATKQVVFMADRYQVRGPRGTDGALIVTLETGEYQAEQVAKVLTIPTDTVVRVTLEYDEK